MDLGELIGYRRKKAMVKVLNEASLIPVQGALDIFHWELDAFMEALKRDWLLIDKEANCHHLTDTGKTELVRRQAELVLLEQQLEAQR